MENKKRLSPLKAIKKYCKEECCAMDRESWVNCSVKNYPLFSHRLGKRYKTLKKEDSPEKEGFLRIDSLKNSVLQAGRNQNY